MVSPSRGGRGGVAGQVGEYEILDEAVSPGVRRTGCGTLEPKVVEGAGGRIACNKMEREETIACMYGYKNVPR